MLRITLANLGNYSIRFGSHAGFNRACGLFIPVFMHFLPVKRILLHRRSRRNNCSTVNLRYLRRAATRDGARQLGRVMGRHPQAVISPVALSERLLGIRGPRFGDLWNTRALSRMYSSGDKPHPREPHGRAAKSPGISGNSGTVARRCVLLTHRFDVLARVDL